MKAYNIRYEFFGRQYAQSGWNIGRAVVVAENSGMAEHQLEIEYYEENPNDTSFSILSSEEMTNNEVVWAY